MANTSIDERIEAVEKQCDNNRTYMQILKQTAFGASERVTDMQAQIIRLERRMDDIRSMIFRCVIGALVGVCVVCLLVAFGSAGAGYFDTHEARKEAAHQMAEAARELGYGEDSAIIQAAKEHYNVAQDEIDTELDLLGRVVYFEAGSSWISDRHQQLVACVVLNRCADSRFPATIKENVYKRGQYACSGRLYTISWDKIPERCFNNAKMAAYDGVECPSGVVWQAQFKQGKGIYEKIGNTYFCY